MTTVLDTRERTCVLIDLRSGFAHSCSDVSEDTLSDLVLEGLIEVRDDGTITLTLAGEKIARDLI